MNRYVVAHGLAAVALEALGHCPRAHSSQLIEFAEKMSKTKSCMGELQDAAIAWARSMAPDEKSETGQERSVVVSLVAAWNKFIRLTPQNHSDRPEFAEAIHRCQDIVAARVGRRTDPTFWSVEIV